jgi:hypothetical protein
VIMLILCLLFFLQATYSYLSTIRVKAAIADSTLNYVSYAFMSDLVKYAITAGLAVQAVNGEWIVIVTTVIGGAIGNTMAHIKK